jgi:EmrB/QacA subfamily drug resistance transporter
MATDSMTWTPTQRWVLALTGAASLLVVLDSLVVSTALSAIRLDLAASVEDLEWTVNAYVLSFAVLLMTAVTVGDRLGRRRVFAAGLGLFAAASVACALATNVEWLIAARAVQGGGAAFVMPLALAQVTAAFPPESRPKALGIFTALTGAAVPLGALVGGAVVEGISWQWIFWLNVPVGTGLVALARVHLDESFGPPRPVDVPGVVLVSGAALGVLWALVRGNPVGWTSTEVLAALAGGLLLGVDFVAWELRARGPMLPMRLFRGRGFAAGNAAIFLLWGSALGSLFFMAQFLQTAAHHGPLGAGVRLVPWGATTFIVPAIAGSLVPRFGERPFIAAGTALHAVALAWIALVAEPDLGYVQLVLPLVLSGAGVAMASPATQSSVLSAVAPADIGSASGTYSTLRQLGGAFGVAVVVAVFTTTGSYASAPTFTDGFAPAMGACAALSLAGTATGLALPRRRHLAEEATTPPVAALDATAG